MSRDYDAVQTVLRDRLHVPAVVHGQRVSEMTVGSPLFMSVRHRSRNSRRVHRPAYAVRAGDHWGVMLLCGAWRMNTGEFLDFAHAADGVMCLRCAGSLAPRGAVYYCYDKGDQLLYVGSSENVYIRTRQHATTAPWWPQVAYFTYEVLPTLDDARRHEAQVIYREQPPHNVVHRVRQQSTA